MEPFRLQTPTGAPEPAETVPQLPEQLLVTSRTRAIWLSRVNSDDCCLVIQQPVVTTGSEAIGE